MTLEEAIRQGESFWITLGPERHSSAERGLCDHLWVLKSGGVVVVGPGAAMSTAAEAHILRGRVGEGGTVWPILGDDDVPVAHVFSADADTVRMIENSGRMAREDAMRYLAFWFPDLRRADLLPQPPELPEPKSAALPQNRRP